MRVMRIVFGLSLLAAMLTASPVAADGRCGGQRGIQVWADSGFSGSTTVWCQNNTGGIAIPDLSTHHEGGQWWPQSWNDAISSFQTFNMPSTLPTCFYQNSNYGSTAWRYNGNQSIQFVGLDRNDQFSSLLVAWPQYNHCGS